MQDIIKNINKSSKRNFDLISCGLASPQMIRSWSWEKLKSQRLLITVHLSLKEMVYSAQRIFGPIKDFECLCGKYKRKTQRCNL